MFQPLNYLRNALPSRIFARFAFFIFVFIAIQFSAVSAAVKFNFAGGPGADYVYYTPFNSTWTGISSDPVPVSFSFALGSVGSVIVPADYNGDTIMDAGVFNVGSWSIKFINHNGSGTTTGTVTDVLGQPGDIPQTGNFLGTREAEIAVFRPSTREWLIKTLPTSPPPAQSLPPIVFGEPTDVPVAEDYDGDCRTDIAVFRPSTGDWWIRYSSTLQDVMIHWGIPGDVPVPADYDGDGKVDIAIYRPSLREWHLRQSLDGTLIKVWGIIGDVPVPADYNGDGKADVAIYRGGQWWVDLPNWPVVSAGTLSDVPIPQ